MCNVKIQIYYIYTYYDDSVSLIYTLLCEILLNETPNLLLNP